MTINANRADAFATEVMRELDRDDGSRAILTDSALIYRLAQAVILLASECRTLQATLDARTEAMA